jgi:hypothetical protein
MAEDETNGTPDFIRITNRDIWNKLNEIEKELRLLAQADLPKRVRALELRFYGILAGFIGAIGGFIVLLTRGT